VWQGVIIYAVDISREMEDQIPYKCCSFICSISSSTKNSRRLFQWLFFVVGNKFIIPAFRNR
jgi:hypothetical protein